MISKIKESKKADKLLAIMLSFFTIVRIYLQVKLPLYLQAGAGFDDFLLVKYAKTILAGQWLGPFDTKTLAKGVSYSLYLAINYLLGIPYSFALIVTYIIAILLFIIVIKKHLSNKYYLSLIYLVLLYSPVMFHIENGQKIYRGGVIVSFSLIVISAMIGIYNSKSEKIKKMVIYSIIASLSLPFFYYLKEDSIWIIPFVLGFILLTVIYLLINKIEKKKTRIFLTILPIISLITVNHIYCSINYSYYQEYAITDRNGTYFKEVMADIIKMEEKQENKKVWINKEMMYKAIDVSPTMQKIKPEIDKMYEPSWAVINGEIEGDIIYWVFKEAVGEAGIYKKGGKYVNNFYKKIDKELDKAYEEGKLKVDKDNKIYISSIGEGFTKKVLIDYYKKETPNYIKMLATYSQNEVSIHEAYGNYEDIVLMDHMTNSVTVWPNETPNENILNSKIVKISNIIVSIYQKTGLIILFSGIVGLIMLTIITIKDMIKKRVVNMDLFLITLGLIVAASTLLFGVQWFCRWFESTAERHLYNYTCGLIPIMQILELIGIYIIIQTINEKRKSRVVKNEKRSKKRKQMG